MTINAIRHKKDNRPFIPSKEEAGCENMNSKVQAKKIAEFPKNPVVHRGQDPELFWLDKYGKEDSDDTLSIDIRSLYRHEHIAPETLISALYRFRESQGHRQQDMFSVPELFGTGLALDEIEKVSEYYKHQDGWTNRLIQGDSLLVMTSLLEREGMAGKVQMVYIDPPYGIKYGSNWQMKLNDRNVKDGDDDYLSGQPEQIKAYRDTWELGIHSYLGYLRDRLLVAKELLTESGSCFVQISDENVHLVRCVMDEVFGSGNFVSQISYYTTSGFASKTLSRAGDYVLWYAKEKSNIKYRQLYIKKENPLDDVDTKYDQIELVNGKREALKAEYKRKELILPKGSRIFRYDNLNSQNPASELQPFEFNNKIYFPNSNSHWKAQYPEGMERLKNKKRIAVSGNTLSYVRYFDDFPLQPINNFWTDLGGTVQSRTDTKVYVVQTGTPVIQRCMLMTTDPGDIVLDPTCGSGTTAYVAEQWGRRWITIDTSRIALNIAKTRLMTATYPYYVLYDEKEKDIR